MIEQRKPQVIYCIFVALQRVHSCRLAQWEMNTYLWVSLAGPHLTFLNTPDGFFSHIPFLKIVKYPTFYPHTAQQHLLHLTPLQEEVKITNNLLKSHLFQYKIKLRKR